MGNFGPCTPKTTCAVSSLCRSQACEVVERLLEGMHGDHLGAPAIGLPLQTLHLPQCFGPVRLASSVIGDGEIGDFGNALCIQALLHEEILAIRAILPIRVLALPIDGSLAVLEIVEESVESRRRNYFKVSEKSEHNLLAILDVDALGWHFVPLDPC